MVGFYTELGDELGLYVRQLAWLRAAPEVKRRGKGAPPEPVSRAKAMKDKGETPLLPPNPAPYLVNWLFDIGPSSGMDSAISWQDMEAWERINGVFLEPWEAKILRDLSRQYLYEGQEARRLDRAAPYNGETADIIERRQSVDQKIRSAFSGLKGKKG